MPGGAARPSRRAASAVLLGCLLAPAVVAVALGWLSSDPASAVVLGLVWGLPTLRLRADYLAIVTLSGAEILRYVVRSQWADSLTASVYGIQRFADVFYDWNPFGEGSYGFSIAGFIVAAIGEGWFGNLLTDIDAGPLRTVLLGAGLILLVVFRPQGLLGNREEVLLDDSTWSTTWTW